jgi:hypothetical protein
MKIRTFLTCEDIDIGDNNNDVIIKKMMNGIYVKQLPVKESIVIILTLDEMGSNPSELKVVMLSPKEKFISEWSKTLEPGKNSMAFRLKSEFLESGKHYIKITEGENFLGKFPFYIRIKEGEINE